MAKDDKTNEEEDDFFGDDDDDFGLPELDYESLGDDDDDTLDDDFDEIGETSFDDEKEETKLEEVVSEEEPETSPEMDIPDDLDDEAIEAALSEDVSDQEMEDFYKEESFEDFESSVDGEELPDSVLDSDVLDEEEFAKFEKELEEQGGLGLDDEEEEDEDKAAKGKFTRIVIIGAVIFLALGGSFWFIYDSYFSESKTGSVAESIKAKSTPTKKPAKAKPKATKEEAKEGTTPTKKPAAKKPKPAAKKPKPKSNPVAANPGTINELSASTGNYYIVIGSFLDDDLAKDYSGELAAQGKSPIIIPPFGNAITYRVAIQGYSDIGSARQNVDGFRGEFGSDIWILRY